MYNFKSKEADGQSLIHVINLMLGKDLIGAEVGVFRALTLCTLLQNCPNIKHIYAIDSYKPYTDFIKNPYNEIPAYSIGEKEIEFIKLTALHNIKWSGFDYKVKILEQDSSFVATQTGNESLDFVFLDTCMTYEQEVQDLKDWYPKVKKGGLFSGHDWNCSAVQRAVNEFIETNKLTQQLSVFDNVWMLIK
jgi:hypothetical protein